MDIKNADYQTVSEAYEKITGKSSKRQIADFICSELNLFNGGITSVDADYDERLGKLLHPYSQECELWHILADRNQALRDKRITTLTGEFAYLKADLLEFLVSKIEYNFDYDLPFEKLPTEARKQMCERAAVEYVKKQK